MLYFPVSVPYFIVWIPEVDLKLLQIQDEALCDNSERLEAVNYNHKGALSWMLQQI